MQNQKNTFIQIQGHLLLLPQKPQPPSPPPAWEINSSSFTNDPFQQAAADAQPLISIHLQLLAARTAEEVKCH